MKRGVRGRQRRFWRGAGGVEGAGTRGVAACGDGESPRGARAEVARWEALQEREPRELGGREGYFEVAASMAAISARMAVRAAATASAGGRSGERPRWVRRARNPSEAAALAASALPGLEAGGERLPVVHATGRAERACRGAGLGRRGLRAGPGRWRGGFRGRHGRGPGPRAGGRGAGRLSPARRGSEGKRRDRRRRERFGGCARRSMRRAGRA